MSQRIDSTCDRCNAVATWRIVSQDGIYIYAAGCNAHKDAIRAELFASFAKLPTVNVLNRKRV